MIGKAFGACSGDINRIQRGREQAVSMSWQGFFLLVISPSALLSSEVTAFKGAQLMLALGASSGLSLLPLEFTLLLLEPLLFPDKDPFEQGPQSEDGNEHEDLLPCV